MITLQQLEYFRELALNGHLTQTAEKLYITQATLSNVIGNLEKQLGVKLFNRVGRHLQLSEVGAKYLDYVLEALSALDNGRTMIENHLQTVNQTVTIAVNNSTVWASRIQTFQQTFPSYSIRQLTYSDTNVPRNLLIGMEADFVIAGTTDFSLTGLEYTVFARSPICLCVPPGHRLAGRTSVTLEEIKDEPFISHPQPHPFQKFCDNLFQKAGIRYHTVLECDYMLSSQLVSAGFGVRLSTWHSYKAKVGLLANNNTCIPIVDDYEPREIALIWNARRNLSQAAQDFHDYLVQEEARIDKLLPV